MVLDYLKKRSNIGLLSILVLALFVFYPVVKNGILKNWDDNDQILINTSVQQLSFENIRHYFSTDVLQSYQPLASLSFALEYSVVGKNPFLYHLDNLLLHLLNIILVFFLLKKVSFLDNFKIILTTAIFALHPLQVETVAWISARSNLLYVLFLLLASICYLNFIKGALFKRVYYLLAIVFFLFSLFSKSAAIIFPFVLILLNFFVKEEKNIKKIAINVFPFLLMSLIFGFYSLQTRGVTGGLVGEFIGQLGYETYERILVSCYSFLFYLYQFIFPIDLYHLYGYPLKYAYADRLPLIFHLSPYIILSLFVFAFFFIKKKTKQVQKTFLFGILFFGITIFLVLNIVAYLAYINCRTIYVFTNHRNSHYFFCLDRFSIF